MIDHNVRDSRCEVPLWFRADGHDLFGIITLPPGVPRGIGVVFVGAGGHAAVDRNRVTVLLARRLAASGFHVLRFDYHDIGESTGKDVSVPELHRPFTTDLMSAVEELRRRGVDEFIFVGRCFGARTALSAAGHIQGLRGLALISMPWYDSVRWGLRLLEVLPLSLRLHRSPLAWHLRLVYYSVRNWVQRARLLDRNADGAGANWVSLPVVRELRRAIDDRVPILFLYGTEDETAVGFRRIQESPIGVLLAQAGARVQTFTLCGHMHALSTVSVQQAVITRVCEWVEAVARN